MQLFLFIFESIGTAELILIGITALIFLGPRKLPEMAHKLGKIMADLRNTTSDFKATWEREVNFEEEAKALRIDDNDPADERPEPRSPSTPTPLGTPSVTAPAVKEIDASRFEESRESELNGSAKSDAAEQDEPDTSISEKRNWL